MQFQFWLVFSSSAKFDLSFYSYFVYGHDRFICFLTFRLVARTQRRGCVQIKAAVLFGSH